MYQLVRCAEIRDRLSDVSGAKDLSLQELKKQNVQITWNDDLKKVWDLFKKSLANAAKSV